MEESAADTLLLLLLLLLLRVLQPGRKQKQTGFPSAGPRLSDPTGTWRPPRHCPGAGCNDASLLL
eukprot:9651579-Lingulodinium_polyedra.AAC.1